MSTNPMLWVGYPRSYTAGRARSVQYVTLHYTAGSEGPTSAEGGANYDKTRTDGTSCHAFFDSSGPGLQEVPFGDRSHSAYFHGNEIGVHYEICGTIQTRAQWLDPTSMATLKTCAQAVAYACEALGLQKRRLSVDETRAAYFGASGQRPTGINDHWTITKAYPEDPGNHTDVGAEFPWDVFMDMVTGGTIKEDVDMPAVFKIKPYKESDGSSGKFSNRYGVSNGPTFYWLPVGPASDPNLYVRACTGLYDIPMTEGSGGAIKSYDIAWMPGAGTEVPWSGSGGVATAVKLTADGEKQVYDQALKAAQSAEDS